MEDHRHTDQAIMAELTGFRELFEERTQNLSSTLERIEVQVLKTNGRVNVLELESAGKAGESRISAILSGGVTAVVISLVVFLIEKSL